MGAFGQRYVAKKIQKSMRDGHGCRIDRREVEKFGFAEIYDWCNNQGWVVHHVFTLNPQTEKHEHTTTVITKSWAHVIIALKNISDDFLEKSAQGQKAAHFLFSISERFRQEYTHLIHLREAGELQDPIRSVFNGKYSRQSPGEQYWRTRREDSGSNRSGVSSMVEQPASG